MQNWHRQQKTLTIYTQSHREQVNITRSEMTNQKAKETQGKSKMADTRGNRESRDKKHNLNSHTIHDIATRSGHRISLGINSVSIC